MFTLEETLENVLGQNESIVNILEHRQQCFAKEFRRFPQLLDIGTAIHDIAIGSYLESTYRPSLMLSTKPRTLYENDRQVIKGIKELSINEKAKIVEMSTNGFDIDQDLIKYYGFIELALNKEVSLLLYGEYADALTAYSMLVLKVPKVISFLSKAMKVGRLHGIESYPLNLISQSLFKIFNQLYTQKTEPVHYYTTLAHYAQVTAKRGSNELLRLFSDTTYLNPRTSQYEFDDELVQTYVQARLDSDFVIPEN